MYSLFRDWRFSALIEDPLLKPLKYHIFIVPWGSRGPLSRSPILPRGISLTGGRWEKKFQHESGLIRVAIPRIFDQFFSDFPAFSFPTNFFEFCFWVFRPNFSVLLLCFPTDFFQICFWVFQPNFFSDFSAFPYQFLVFFLSFATEFFFRFFCVSLIISFSFVFVFSDRFFSHLFLRFLSEFCLSVVLASKIFICNIFFPWNLLN